MTSPSAPDLANILTCTACDGSGTEYTADPCTACDGTDDDCTACDGHGELETWDDCTNCGGDGHHRPHRDYEPFMTALIGALSPLTDNGWTIDAGAWCCQSCAFAATNTDGRFVGFTEQDAEGLAQHGTGLYLFHHLPTPGDTDTLVTVLTDAGFDVDWPDHDPSIRPHLTLSDRA